jgi:hypothetical protein
VGALANSRRSTSFPNNLAAVALTSELSLLSNAIMAGMLALIASSKGTRMHSQSSVGVETQRNSQNSVGVETRRNSRRSTNFSNNWAAVALTSELSLLSNAIMAGMLALIASSKGTRMHSQSSVGVETQRNSQSSMSFSNNWAAVALTSELSLLSNAIMAGMLALIASSKEARMHSQSSVGVETQRNSHSSMNFSNNWAAVALTSELTLLRRATITEMSGIVASWKVARMHG